MKKMFLAAGLAVALTLSASAQTKKKAPPSPPKPPHPPVEVVDVVPPPPPPSPPPPPPPPPIPGDKEKVSLPEDFQDFLNRNPSVESVYWDDDVIVIVPKQGDKERFTLNEKGIRDAEAKYGKLPQAPPPPPAPPAPPKAPRAPKPKTTGNWQ